MTPPAWLIKKINESEFHSDKQSFAEDTMTDLAWFRISFGIAAFIFEMMLLILVMVLGHRQRNNNMKFRTMVILTLCGTVVSIMDNLFRVTRAFASSLVFQLFLLLCFQLLL